MLQYNINNIICNLTNYFIVFTFKLFHVDLQQIYYDEGNCN